MAGAIVYFTIAIVRLEWSTRRLPYLLLGRQEAFAAPGAGVFSRLGDRLTKMDRRMQRRGPAGGVSPDGKKRAVRPHRR